MNNGPANEKRKECLLDNIFINIKKENSDQD